MQTFDADIKKVVFSFIRVTYGKGDLWYHISFAKDDKRITFRMTKNNSDTWQIFDKEDFYLNEFEPQLCQSILDFEKDLLNKSSAETLTPAPKVYASSES